MIFHRWIVIGSLASNAQADCEVDEASVDLRRMLLKAEVGKTSKPS